VDLIYTVENGWLFVNQEVQILTVKIDVFHIDLCLDKGKQRNFPHAFCEGA